MKKLVLDLDESLVYSSMEAISPSCIELHASGSTFYTMLRPGAKTFVEYVSKRFEEPRFTPLECKMCDQTYSSKLKATLRLRST